jgi:hypothetical protein
LVLSFLILIAACAQEKPSPDGAEEPETPSGGEARFPCGAAEIRLAAADVGRIEEAFGPDGLGDKVCAIFGDAAGGASAEPETMTATMPTGETVRAEAVRASPVR